MADYLFYDLESFKYDYTVIFMDYDGEEIAYYHNNNEGMADLIAGKILVGYNNHFYDDPILTKILHGWTPEQINELSQKLVHGQAPRVNTTSLGKTYDTFQQIDVGKPGLKKIEANIGHSILESDIDFNIDRPLTVAELDSNHEYNANDVRETVNVFKMREKDYFVAKEDLIAMMDKPSKTVHRWNTTTIASNLLLKKPLTKWSGIRLGDTYEGDYELWKYAPPEAREMWETKEKGTFTTRLADNKIVFSFGGIHGYNTTKKYFEDVYFFDVGSMFPNIIVLLNILGAATKKYAGILEHRLAIKKTEPDLAYTLKIILNSVYGQLRSKYSMLFNPKAALSINVYSQIALYELTRRLQYVCTIVNINTDGIAISPNTKGDLSAVKEVINGWEADFKLKLDQSHYTKMWQKDVSNYIAENDNGHLKVKGPDVSKYYKDAPFKNNSLRIVDIAVVNYIVEGTDVITTLQENLDKPHLFQYVLQAGGTYAGTFDENGKKYNKVNRVFAGKNGVTLYKKKHNDSLVKFPDAPTNMLVWNDDTRKINDFGSMVDLTFYYRLINKTLERWAA